MRFGYTFPHLRRFDGLPRMEYVMKIAEEAEEVREAFCSSRAKVHGKFDDDTVIEIMDVMQACETALRNSGRSFDEIKNLYLHHNDKDEMRGYRG